ncbi:MAG: septation ring formation regulator EzrA [Bacilli bacterium]|nr:septation ring formation regulator EzrA [Bacilli bacterium]
MDMVILLSVSIFIVSVILIIIVLYLLQNRKNKKYKEEIDKLEIEKNKLDSSPVIPELSKIESYLNNEKLEAMYNNWKERLDVIRTNQIPKITDMLLDADYSLSKMDYKKTIYKIAKLEMEIYKVRTNSEFLLNEIKEITGSEERNRAIITKLKIKYRELYQKFQNSKQEYGNIEKTVELQFESIAHKFEEFENLMEKNEYTEVVPIVKNIDDMIKHMTNVVEELPGIYLLATSILPKKIDEVKEKYEKMTKKGYPLDYLNIEYNIKEAEEKISDILTRAQVLNIEDSLFELKVLLDYFESLFTDFEKEKVNKSDYEEANKVFKIKFDKINNLMNDMLNSIDEIKTLYNLSENDLEELYKIKEELDLLKNDYDVLIEHTSNNTFAFSALTKEIENLSLKLAKLDQRVDVILDSIGSMKEDEIRARQQLEEIKVILKESKTKIREYSLPVIPKTYFVELNDAQMAIKEIIKELDKKPITINVLNTRVDTARDLVLKLYQTTKEMVRTAMFAEMAIVYGNRYRSDVEDLDKYLKYSEKLFYRGEYKKSLEVSINSLDKVEKGIYDKLLKLYSNN